MLKNKTLAKSNTKTIDISGEPKKVFEFLSNPLNWPQFAIVNLRSIQKGKDGWYDIVSKNGQGKLKMLANKEYGILDHIWEDSQATWKVFMRVVPNGEGSSLAVTFFHPTQIDIPTFELSMKQMDLEFAKLKEILEA
jgi:hypothetical protein